MTLVRGLRKRLPLFLLMSLVAAAATWTVVSKWQPEQRVHFSYLVSLAERESSQEYTYDGYYALQATDLFTSTLTGWVQTPDFIVEAYQVAGLPLPTDDARRLTRLITARKTAPQLVEVEVRGGDRAIVEKVARGLQAVTQRRLADYLQQGAPALPFKVVASSGWTSTTQAAREVITLSVFSVTLILLVNFYLLQESIRRASSY